MDIYPSLIRPLLFSALKTDPEWLHQQSLGWLRWLAENRHTPTTSWILQQLEKSYSYQDARLQQNLWGLEFPNPLGLAAGFDKNGVAAGIWQKFGFGFAELGTVTCHSQPGNPQPRLFRLLEDKAVLNRMGFNNQGKDALSKLLVTRKAYQEIPWGINLGKSKVTPLEEAAGDYLASFQSLSSFGDYFVVNVSSPNTPGLRSLQDASQLSLILAALQENNPDKKPILVKIAPDLSWEAIADVIDLAKSYQLAGIIATNTTISRDNLKTGLIQATGKTVKEEMGGISGLPVRDRSTAVIRYIYRETGGSLPIIGVGGIFTAEDAWEKITAGASLIQVYTGWVYEGPGMVKKILQGLVKKLDENGLGSIREAVGRESN